MPIARHSDVDKVAFRGSAEVGRTKAGVVWINTTSMFSAAAPFGGWSGVTAHSRAQVLYFLVENLSQRQAGRKGDKTIRHAFWYAAQADKFDGAVTATKSRHVTVTVNEAYGAMGIVASDEAPLLSLMSLILLAVTLGNRVVAIASQSHPLIATRLLREPQTHIVGSRPPWRLAWHQAGTGRRIPVAPLSVDVPTNYG